MRRPLRGLKVLVVDDHAPTAEILALILRRCGASVVEAASAAEALALYRKDRPDVVVSDIGMPGEDGLTLVDQIRNVPECGNGPTPAIALTAYIRQEDAGRLLAGGFQATLTKPVEPVELVNAIRDITAANAARLGSAAIV